jgi:O-antigen/teichoic acid export membrane protein
MNAGTRVIYNTAVLYIRLLIGMGLGLFTTRLVLSVLGETDFGIYTLVAGVVGMLGILNSSMTNASMRFMAHSLGSGDMETMKKTFNTTLFLHFVIGIVVVLIMEAGGLLMFDYLLNIPEEKIFAAKIVFHFMVFTTFITIISVPYDAVMNSHENLLALSLVDILGYILKLGIAVYLSYSDLNLLIMYGFLMLMTQIVLRIIKQWYSRVKYQECKINFRVYIDKDLSKTILSFSGWNLFGSIASMSVTQVRGILLNMFFGVSINAADGISKTASAQVNTVASSMTRALNPQLVKSEGSGNRQKMLRFTEMATKFSVFLFALFAIPVIIETPYLLNFWLKNVPEFAIIFCQLLLIGSFFSKFSFEITSAIRAVGKIRNFQVAETALALLVIPISYLILKIGYPPYSIFLVNILIGIFAFALRLYFGKMIAGMDIRLFFRNAIYPILLPLILTIIASFLPQLIMPQSFLRLSISTLVSLIVMTTSFWFFGLKVEEANKLKQIFYSATNKLWKTGK